ncbi:MAG TPA: hypothetical protein VIP58_11585 [Nocardioides sp.]
MELTPDVAARLRERAAIQVWLTTSTNDAVVSFDDVARLAGLEPLGRAWVEVDAARARTFLAGLLHRDLAYKSEVMPSSTADWLAGEFLGAFGRYGVRVATNSKDLPHEFPFSWTPATDYTFDAGIVVVGQSSCGLYWVADED